MSAGNGTPPGIPPPPPMVLGSLSHLTDRECIELGARQSHHAWVTAAGGVEWTRELGEQLHDMRTEHGDRFTAIERRLGIVEATPRDGSSPHLVRLADLKLDEEETEVRRKRLALDEEERAKTQRAKNRARAWAIFFRVAQLVAVGIATWLVARACGG